MQVQSHHDLLNETIPELMNQPIHQKESWEYSSVVMPLPSMEEALGLLDHTTTKHPIASEWVSGQGLSILILPKTIANFTLKSCEHSLYIITSAGLVKLIRFLKLNPG